MVTMRLMKESLAIWRILRIQAQGSLENYFSPTIVDFHPESILYFSGSGMSVVTK